MTGHTSDPLVILDRVEQAHAGIAQSLAALHGELAHLRASLSAPGPVWAPPPTVAQGPGPVPMAAQGSVPVPTVAQGTVPVPTAAPGPTWGAPPVRPHPMPGASAPTWVPPHGGFGTPPVAMAPASGAPALPGAPGLPQQFGPPAGPPVWHPPAPATPWHRREGVLPRVLAFAGAGVLLIGVAFLLVLAAQSGLFGPVPRTVAGGVLAAGLVAAGVVVWQRHRGNAGAVALVAAGFAAAYLDVAAISALYGWLPRPVGLALGGAVGLAGLGVARWWRSQALGVITLAGALLLVPAVSATPTSALAFMILATIAAAAFDIERGWSWLAGVRSIPTAVVAIVVAATLKPDQPDFPLLLAGSALLTGVGLAACWWGERPGLSPRYRVVNATVLPLLVLPLLMAASRLEVPVGPAVLAVVGILLLAVAFLPRLGLASRGSIGAMGLLAFLALVATYLDSAWQLPAVLTLGLASLLVGWLGQDRPSHWRGVVVFGCAALAWLTFSVGVVSAELAGRTLTVQLALSAVLVAGGAILLARDAVARHSAPPGVVFSALVGALVVIVTVAIVTLGVLLGDALGHLSDGFWLAHALATIGWFVTGAWLLLSALRRHRGQQLGLVLTGAAVVKLFLFDLQALPGVPRILAFIASGLVLIVLGVLYAQAAEAARRDGSTDPGQAAPPLPPAGPTTPGH